MLRCEALSLRRSLMGLRAVLSGETGIKACRELGMLPRCAAGAQRGHE